MVDNEFQRLWDAGFRTLLPIIPFDATLSPRAKSIRDKPGMIGKIPGFLRADGWVGMANWTTYQTRESELAEWHEDGAGIGLRCEQVVAIDVDVTDEITADAIASLALQILGPAPQRTGNYPKVLLPYRLLEPGSWPTKRVLTFFEGEQKHAIEVLGARQQFIVQGVHPKTEQPYTWTDDLAALELEGLTGVEPQDVDRFLTECRDYLEMLGFDCDKLRTHGHDDERDPEALACQDMALLSRAVCCIPNDEHNGYNELATMAHAVRMAAGEHVEEGRAILQEWSERWSGGEHDAEETDRIYDSIDGAAIGIQWILDKARAEGFSCASDDFGDESEAGETDDADEYVPEADSPEFFKTWCYVNRLKRFINLHSDQEHDKEQFNDLYITLGDSQKPADFMLQTKYPGTFADDVDYRPGDHNKVGYSQRLRRTTLNRWRPGPAQDGTWDGPEAVTDKDVELWLELAEYLFPNDDEREVLFNWMASILQRPGVKPNWHPLIGSHVHGTGKDSLFAPLVAGLGDNVSVIRTGDIEGQWTWWAENKQLIIVSEIQSFERKAVMSKLKSYMTTPPYTVEINKKGIGQYEVPNLFGMVFFTNEEGAVAIERYDRRFFVMWSDAGKRPFSYYKRFHDWMGVDEGHCKGALLVVRWLLQRDISAFSVKGDAPATAAKEVMRRAAMAPVEGSLLDGIESEEGPFCADLVTSAQVREWLKAQTGKPGSPQRIGSLLRSNGAVLLGKARINDSEGVQSIWAVRRQNMYQALVDTHGVSAVRDRLLKQSRERANNDAQQDFLG